MKSTTNRYWHGSVLVSVMASTMNSSVLLAENLNNSANTPRKLDMVTVVGQATAGLDTVVTRSELDDIQANDLDDVFLENPSVSVGGAVSSGQKIYIRNIGEDMLNITVDGAEQANAVFHHSGRVSIEPELLQQVEVEAGAGSAAAGPGALGGAVRFTTKDPADLLRAEENSGAIVKGGYNENGAAYKTSVTVYGRDQTHRYSGMASAVLSESDNLEDGRGDDILGSEEQGKVGFLKGVVQLNDEQSVSVSYENLERKGDILYKPELISSVRNQPAPTQHNRVAWTLNYDWLSLANELLDLSVTLYQTEHEQERFIGAFYDGSVETLGLTVQNRSTLGVNEFIYGINFRDDTSTLHDVDFAQYTFEEEGTVAGVFVQDIISVTDQLTVSTGVRFDRYQLDDVNGQSFSDDGISPNISANYEFKPGYSMSLGYAEAFRGPEVKDAFKLSVYSNAADLEGETAKNLELGLDIVQGALVFGAGVFNTRIEDPVVNENPWDSNYFNGEEDIESVGYYASLAYDWQKLSASASYSAANTEVGDEKVTRYVYSSNAISVGDTLVTKLAYDPTPKWRLGWIMEWVQPIHTDTIEVDGQILTFEKNGYVVHDIFAQWQPLADDTLLLALTVKNLFDRDYFDHGSVEDLRGNAGYELISGQPEPGRDVRLAATLRF